MRACPLPFPRTAATAAVLALSTLVGCSDLTAPAGEDPRALSQLPTPSGSSGGQKSAKGGESVSASHVLVAYKGARRAGPQVTRTKDEARAEANRILGLARAPNADFAALAKAHSDDPGSGSRGGELGSFQRSAMIPAFSDAAFALSPGQVSEVVETDFGFHIIKRTK